MNNYLITVTCKNKETGAETKEEVIISEETAGDAVFVANRCFKKTNKNPITELTSWRILTGSTFDMLIKEGVKRLINADITAEKKSAGECISCANYIEKPIHHELRGANDRRDEIITREQQRRMTLEMRNPNWPVSVWESGASNCVVFMVEYYFRVTERNLLTITKQNGKYYAKAMNILTGKQQCIAEYGTKEQAFIAARLYDLGLKK